MACAFSHTQSTKYCLHIQGKKILLKYSISGLLIGHKASYTLPFASRSGGQFVSY